MTLSYLNTCIFSQIDFLYTESSVHLPYVKLSGSLLLSHSVKYAAVNIYCNIMRISMSLMAGDNRLFFCKITAVASGFASYSALKLRMLIASFCSFVSL